MIAPDVAGREVMRLRVTQGFGKIGKDEFQQRVAALAKHAANDEHARDAVTAILDNSPWFPSVADIVRYCDLTPAPQVEVTQQWRGCAACSGTGYEYGLYLVTWEDRRRKRERITREEADALRGKLGGIVRQQIYEGSQYCACEFGRHLAARRMAQEAMEAA